ncbi:MAG: hypothetical protein JAY82_18410, partial [Candidatus Thiodiazotropha taylori]|nr:hypothetical protein [Candidatus Thiodiazotropha taylori]
MVVPSDIRVLAMCSIFFQGLSIKQSHLTIGTGQGKIALVRRNCDAADIMQLMISEKGTVIQIPKERNTAFGAGEADDSVFVIDCNTANIIAHLHQHGR